MKCFSAIFLLAVLALGCKKNDDPNTQYGSLPGCDVLSVTRPNSQNYNITYDYLGRVATVTYPNSGSNSPTVNTATYNTPGQLIKYGNNDKYGFYKLYYYDRSGHLTMTAQYMYDFDSSKIDLQSRFTFTYGNNSITALAYSKNNHLSMRWEASLDANGNIVSSMVYDSNNKEIVLETAVYDDKKNPFAGDKYLMFDLFQAKRMNNPIKTTSKDLPTNKEFINSNSYRYNTTGYPDFVVLDKDTTYYAYKCH